MLRVSVTTLESYRRFINEVSPVDTEENLVNKLKGLFFGNDKTRIGSSFHSIVEDPERSVIPDPDRPGVYIVGEDKIRMNAKQLETGLKYRENYPTMIHEVPIYKIYKTPRAGEVMVTGKTDGINGRTVRDVKVKFSAPNYEEYLDSAQWKLYLDILGVDVFFYDFFEVKGFNESNPTDITGAEIMAHEPLKCTRFINLSAQCENLVVDFMEYIHDREYYNLLKQAHNYETSIF